MGFIASVEAFPENLELKEPYSIASGTQYEANYVLVVVKDADGRIGVGEASPMPGYSHETQASILSAIREKLAGSVLGGDVGGISKAVDSMDEAMVGAEMAKSAIEVAMTDLIARKLGVSVVDYLGGSVRGAMGVAGGIGFMDRKGAARKAKSLVENGVTTIKVKIGRSIDEDMELVRAIRGAAGKDVSLRLDANQGYSAATAVPKLKKLEQFEPALFEQPVAEDDIEGMARITRMIDTPIMADEPIHNALDVIEYASADAADLVKVKVNKCGGLRKTAMLCETARIFDVGVVIGSGHESSIGVASEVALGLAYSNFDQVGEMNGNQRLVREWVKAGLFPSRGQIRGWKEPGLGLEYSIPQQKNK